MLLCSIQLQINIFIKLKLSKVKNTCYYCPNNFR